MTYRVKSSKNSNLLMVAGSDWPGGEGGSSPQAPCLIKFIRIDIDLYIR